MVGLEPTLLAESDFRILKESRLLNASPRSEPHTFRAYQSAPVRPYAAPSSQEEPADVYAIARKRRTALRRGFQYQHLSFSIA